MSPKDPRSLAIRLSAWLQEEIAAQHRLDAMLADQERAIRAADTDAILASGAQVEAELRAGSARERRRKQLMAELGRTFGADAKALTVRSIAVRLGAETREGEMLLAQRAELRAVAARVTRRGRRIAGLARYHAELFGELMNTLLGVEGARPLEDGALIDAKV